MINKFDEFDFKDYLKYHVGFSIRKHKRGEWSEIEIDNYTENLIEDLSPMELVCYLGNYLTKQNEEE